jgi:hypothetical protein
MRTPLSPPPPFSVRKVHGYLVGPRGCSRTTANPLRCVQLGVPSAMGEGEDSRLVATLSGASSRCRVHCLLTHFVPTPWGLHLDKGGEREEGGVAWSPVQSQYVCMLLRNADSAATAAAHAYPCAAAVQVCERAPAGGRVPLHPRQAKEASHQGWQHAGQAIPATGTCRTAHRITAQHTTLFHCTPHHSTAHYTCALLPCAHSLSLWQTPWAVRSTSTDSQTARAGTEFSNQALRQSDHMAMRSRAMYAEAAAYPRGGGGDSLGPNMDFLPGDQGYCHVGCC